MKNRLIAFLKDHPFSLFLLKFVVIFGIGYTLFRCYVGLIDPQGDYYWPGLTYLDLLQLIRNAIKYPLAVIMQLLGYETVFSKHGLMVHQQLYWGGINIAYPCLGVEVMLTYIALILAYDRNKKLLFIGIGLLMIHALNIGRMMGILLLMSSSHQQHIQTAHDLFNLIAYGTVLALFYLYASRPVRDITE